jgi:alpha-galactosidase
VDNLYIGNGDNITSVVILIKWQTMEAHWVGVTAKLIAGSDLTQLNSDGSTLFNDSEAREAAVFTAQYPMQPRNPGSIRSAAKQHQA